MTELELYKFVTDNKIEYHWNHNNTECYLLINNHLINDLHKLLNDSNMLDDDGIKCVMRNGYFGFEMVEICEYFDIEPKNIFTELFPH